MSKVLGYVVNNYSSSGMVQVKRFGEDDGVSDPEKLKWVYVCQKNNNVGVAGVGENHCLQPGCRVHMSEYGGKDGSYIAEGTFGRMGSGEGDSSTSFNGVNRAQSDYCMPLKNPDAPNGVRCQVKAPDGRYNKKAGGSPLDLSGSQYPDTQYKE